MSQSRSGSRLPAAAAAWLGRVRVRMGLGSPAIAPHGADPAHGVVPLLPRGRFDALLRDGLRDAQDIDADWISILHVGIDRLGTINDACGCDVGDAVLEATSRQLRNRTEALIAQCKVAGDEYALCVALPPGEARQVAAKLVAEFRQGIETAGRRRSIDLSVGIASSPREKVSSGLVRCAARAMRSVKARGGAAIAVFDRESQQRQRADLEIVRELSLAIARNQLRLVYQPKVDAVALQVTAVEALLRWTHPALGAVSPAVFIPIAERHGMMDTIGDWVIQQSLADAAQWRRQGLRMRIAINVSGKQLQRGDFAARLQRCLAQHKLPPRSFTCEITESMAVAESPVALRSLAQLKNIGVHLSIDDFGTGYSGLSTLCRLPAQELKLDRSLVAEVEHSASARVIVQSVVDMAHAMRLRVVAEGIENVLQRDLVLAAGCDELQGFFCSKPMDARSIAVWAFDHHAAPGPAFRPSLYGEAVPVNGDPLGTH